MSSYQRSHVLWDWGRKKGECPSESQLRRASVCMCVWEQSEQERREETHRLMLELLPHRETYHLLDSAGAFVWLRWAGLGLSVTACVTVWRWCRLRSDWWEPALQCGGWPSVSVPLLWENRAPGVSTTTIMGCNLCTLQKREEHYKLLYEIAQVSWSTTDPLIWASDHCVCMFVLCILFNLLLCWLGLGGGRTSLRAFGWWQTQTPSEATWKREWLLARQPMPCE